MKSKILTLALTMFAAAAVLACEKTPDNGDKQDPGTEIPSDEDPDTGESDDDGQANTILAGTFNIRYYNTGDGSNSWENRRDAVMDFINTSSADIMAMQEVCQIPGQYITAGLDDKYGWFEMDRNTGNSILDNSSSEGVFLIWNQDRFSLKNKGYFWLADPWDQFPALNEDGTYSSWNSALPRLALWLELEDTENPGQMVYFVGTHYDHYSSRAKTGSSNLIISRIREIAGITDIKNADVAVFVAGDFNTEYDAVELAAMRNAMYDARTTSPKTSTTQVTFNNFGGDGQTIIDHIFYGGNIEAEAYEVITGSYGVPYISDHYPVLFRCSYK